MQIARRDITFAVNPDSPLHRSSDFRFFGPPFFPRAELARQISHFL